MSHIISKIAVAAAVATCGFAGTQANAALLAYEGFDYAASPTATNIVGGVASHDYTTWTGVNGGTGWGSKWGWTAGAASFTANTQVLSYTDGSSNVLPTTGNSGHTSRSTRSASRQLSATYSSGTYWLSFLIRPDYTQGTDDTKHAIYVSIDSGNGVTSSEKFSVGNTTNASVNYSLRNGLGTPVESTVATADEVTHFLVVRYSIGTTTSDGTIHLFIDPANLGVEPTLGSAAASLTGLNSTTMSFNRISFRTPASDPAGETSRNRGYVDEIRLGETYTDVTGIPEPASLGLLALAGAGLVRRRRA